MFECRMCGDVFDIYDEAERHVIEEHAEELFVEDEELRRFILVLRDVAKNSTKCYESLKTLLKILVDVDSDGSVIETCNAIAKWEEMDLHITNLIGSLITLRAVLKLDEYISVVR